MQYDEAENYSAPSLAALIIIYLAIESIQYIFPAK